MTNLIIINGSIREGRIGAPIGEWVKKRAEEDGRFSVDYADLAELNLPLLTEPNHPRLRKYTQENTKNWSDRVDAADAVIILTPEFNHSYAAPIKNALDYLNNEWNRKPVSLVTWGGNSGGTRAAAALKPVLSTLGLVPTKGSVEINFPWQQTNEDGEFLPNDQQSGVIKLILDELVGLGEALQSQRD